jgi:hypothetical protein
MSIIRFSIPNSNAATRHCSVLGFGASYGKTPRLLKPALGCNAFILLGNGLIYRRLSGLVTTCLVMRAGTRGQGRVGIRPEQIAKASECVENYGKRGNNQGDERIGLL